MRKMTYPKTKVFNLSTKSFVILMACFKVFLKKDHSAFFRDFVMSTPDFQAVGSLSDFCSIRPVKGVDIVFHYE